MQHFTDEHRRWRMAGRHRLSPMARTDDIGRITNDLVALHSSDPATVFLSLFARMTSPSVTTIERALYEDRSVIRHHAMRRTMWVMEPRVARLAHAATTAKIARAERKRTEAAIEATTDISHPSPWMDEALVEIMKLLRCHGDLSSRQIGQALPHLMVPVIFGVNQKQSASMNAHTKVLQGAGFDGDLLRTKPTGGWNSAEYVWTPTEAWIGEPLRGFEEHPAAAELLDLWLRRFGPATLTDIRWWFGWTARLAKSAIASSGAIEVRLDDGQHGYVAAGDDELPEQSEDWVQLLPGLDPTAMGWKERDWYLDPDHVPRLFDRFGNAGPTVWADGRIVGGWVQRSSGEITFELTTKISPTHRTLLNDVIERMQNAIGDVVVRPRFPAPVQKDLVANA